MTDGVVERIHKMMSDPETIPNEVALTPLAQLLDHKFEIEWIIDYPDEINHFRRMIVSEANRDPDHLVELFVEFRNNIVAFVDEMMETNHGNLPD